MDLKLDASGYLVLVDGDFVLVDGLEAIAQDIGCELRRWLREDRYDPGGGMPYEQVIFANGTTPQAVVEIMREVIRKREGVQDVLELAPVVDRVNRTITISGRVRALDQELPVDLVIGG